MSADLAWTLAEVGRVAFTHALDPTPIAAALRVDHDVIATLIETGELPDALPAIDQRVAAFVLNIVVRLEVRCGGDSTSIDSALGRPSPELAGRSIAEALLASPDMADLAAIRDAAGKLPVPKVKMWRVPDNYS